MPRLRTKGLPIADGADPLVGETAPGAGVAPGFSGAPALDPIGRVVGVTISAGLRGMAPRRELALVRPQGGRARGQAVLAERSLIFVEPIRSPDVRAALGMSPPSDRASSMTLVLAGYPLGYCASVALDLVPA